MFFFDRYCQVPTCRFKCYVGHNEWNNIHGKATFFVFFIYGRKMLCDENCKNKSLKKIKKLTIVFNQWKVQISSQGQYLIPPKASESHQTRPRNTFAYSCDSGYFYFQNYLAHHTHASSAMPESRDNLI